MRDRSGRKEGITILGLRVGTRQGGEPVGEQGSTFQVLAKARSIGARDRLACTWQSPRERQLLTPLGKFYSGSSATLVAQLCCRSPGAFGSPYYHYTASPSPLLWSLFVFLLVYSSVFPSHHASLSLPCCRRIIDAGHSLPQRHTADHYPAARDLPPTGPVGWGGQWRSVCC